MIPTFSPIGLITGNGRFLIASDDKNSRRETIVWSKLYRFVLLVCLFVLFTLAGLAQSVGDYRSVGSGDWNVLATWERHNGTAWNTPTTLQGYPGQFAGTNAVLISAGNNVTAPLGIPSTITMGTVTVNGLITIAANLTFRLATRKLVITSGLSPPASIVFNQKSRLQLLAGAEIVLGPDGLVGSCNNNNEIIIGSVTFSQCVGGGSDNITFDDLMNGGGTINATASSISPICANSSTTILGGFTGTAGDPTTYSWTGTGPGGYTFSSSSQNNTIILTAVGNYTFNLTVNTTINGVNYSNIESTTVVVNSIPQITSVTAISNPICSNSTTTLSANGVSGDGAIVTWWSGPGGSGTNYGTGINLVKGPGIYYARVTGTCTPATESSIIVSSLPTLSISTQPNDQTDCYYNMVNFIAGTSGGTGTVNYQWQIQNTSGTFVDIVPDSYVLNSTSGTLRIENIGVGNYQDQTIYRLKATDDCSTIYSNPATLTVNEITAISPGTTSATQTTICEGENFTFSATTTGSPISYQWQKDGLPLVNGTFSGVTISGANTPTLLVLNASPLEIGFYKIQVVFNLVDGSGIPKTCQKTSGLNRNVTVNPKPTISGTLAIGTGSTTQLTGSGTAATTNPWISANPAVATVDNTGLVTGISAGTSKITYTNSNGCSVDATVSISGTADIEVTKTAIASIAPGAWITYTITITNHGLATAPTITLTDNLPVALLNPQYSVNSSGVWNNWTGTIDILNLPNTGIETILIKAKVDCSANGSISNTASVLLSPITDSNSANNTFTVITPVSGSPLAVSAVPTSVSCSGLADGTINLTVSGGTPFSIAPFYTYSWTGPGSFSSSSEDISGLIAGTYAVTVTDANGCTIGDSFTVGTTSDITPPTFTPPTIAAGYCPIDIFQAVYNEDQSDPNLDLTFPRPDYYLFGVGNILLDLTNVADNCALAANPIFWKIDFGNNGSVELSGNGQLSTYGTAIQFPVGDNLITYVVTDVAGKTKEDAVILTVIPRPTIIPDF